MLLASLRSHPVWPHHRVIRRCVELILHLRNNTGRKAKHNDSDNGTGKQRACTTRGHSTALNSDLQIVHPPQCVQYIHDLATPFYWKMLGWHSYAVTQYKQYKLGEQKFDVPHTGSYETHRVLERTLAAFSLQSNLWVRLLLANLYLPLSPSSCSKRPSDRNGTSKALSLMLTYAICHVVR